MKPSRKNSSKWVKFHRSTTQEHLKKVENIDQSGRKGGKIAISKSAKNLRGDPKMMGLRH
jgi:hypothetical protein